MILHLDDRLIDNINVNDIIYLEYICQAAREGKHRVIGSRKILSYIIDNNYLSNRNNIVLRSIYNSISQDLSLKNCVCWYVNILPAEGFTHSIQAIGNAKVINLPLPYIDDSRILQETNLVGENINDAIFFEYAGRMYIKVKKLGNIKLRTKPRNGGGDTTSIVFKDIQHDKSVCLCIVDSDKKAPDDTIKETARKVADVDCSAYPLSHSVILNVHEVENLIPTKHIKTAFMGLNDYSNAVDKLEVLDKCDDARLYFDFKKGLCCKDILEMNFNQRLYWTNVVFNSNDLNQNSCLSDQMCQDEGTCCCELIPKLGQDALTRTLTYYNTTSIDKLCHGIDRDAHDALLNIGSLIFSWCIGGNNSITI